MAKLSSACSHPVAGVDSHAHSISLLRPLFLAFLIVACLSLIRGLSINPSYHTVLKDVISDREIVDEAKDYSCLSRTQESLLRPAERQIQMPALLAEAWKSYGELHRHCNSDGELRSRKSNCSYLIVLDSQLVGLGNRFMGLASAMAYAMATDRVLLLDNRRKLGDLLCEPFPASSWLLSDDSPYYELVGKAWGVAAYAQHRRDSGKHVAVDHHQMVKVSLWDEPSDGDMEFFCEEMYSSVMDVKWVVWESDLYTIPNLFLVPSFWQRMSRLFVDAEHEVFALISRLVLLPANDVWAIVLKEHVAYLAGAGTRVGIQIRLHGRSDRAAFDEDANTMAMGCLVNSSYLPGVSGKPKLSAAELAIMYGKRIGHERVEADVAVLVTSLQSRYALRMKQLYSQSAGTEDGRVVRVHSVSELQTQDFGFRQSQLAQAEMWLLSSSDRLATSSSSTFGYAAQAWGNVRPLILDFPNVRVTPDCCQCKEGYAIDPCSHLPRTPPGFKMTNLEAPHQRWLHVHIRRCQDRPEAAWQLVHGGVLESTAPPVFDLST